MPFKIAPARINQQRGFLFDERERLRCFYDGSLYNWVVVDTDHATPVVKIGDQELLMQPYLYNGEPVWAVSSPMPRKDSLQRSIACRVSSSFSRHASEPAAKWA